MKHDALWCAKYLYHLWQPETDDLVYGGNVEIRSVMPIEYDASSENFLEARIQA